MNCNHEWQAGICVGCGITYRTWAEREIAALKAELDAAKAREAKLRKAAQPLVESAPDWDGYPKEWDTDSCFVKTVAICELIQLKRALEAK